MVQRSITLYGAHWHKQSKDIEIFIVGDGTPESTREVVAQLIKEDKRMRFFDHPKGPRHGESYRHAALGQAQGEIVCYLSDDDLWLPNHIETMQKLLRNADFAHALPLRVNADGSLGGWSVDLAIPEFREFHLVPGHNTIPLSCGVHTMAMYRRLPYGWRSAPPTVWTDLYMWQQFFSQSDCRLASGTLPTVLHFLSPQRTEWTFEQRMAELEHWTKKLHDSQWHAGFVLDVLDCTVRERARLAMHNISLRQWLHQPQSATERLTNEIIAIQSTSTWRLRNRLLRLPLSRTLRWVARALAGPSMR